MRAIKNAFLIIFCYITICSCNSRINNYKENDTSAILKVLLDSAFYKPVLINEIPKDTVVFQYHDVLKNYLPQQLKYKLLKENDMCEFMAVRKISSLEFFRLDEFEKNPKGYRAALGIHCRQRGPVTYYPEERTDTTCEKENYCNKILYMDFVKMGKTLIGSKFQIMTY